MELLKIAPFQMELIAFHQNLIIWFFNEEILLSCIHVLSEHMEFSRLKLHSTSGLNSKFKFTEKHTKDIIQEHFIFMETLNPSPALIHEE